jgi:hypothetical protein
MPWLLLDVAWLIAFAAIGRQSHAEGESLAGVAAVAWPFLVGYAVGAFALRLPRAPRSLGRLLPVWALMLVIAMALRTIEKGRAPEIDFVIVAAVFSGLGMAAWRLVALVVGRRRAARAADVADA